MDEDVENCISSNIQLMSSVDADSLQKLHEASFPVRYNKAFYDSVSTGIYRGVPMQAYTVRHDGEFAGAIIGQLYESLSDADESPMYSEEAIKLGYVSGCYVLTLATVEEYRRLGLGSKLLKKIISTSMLNPSCGAVYLHVITYNNAAIRFYEAHGFYKVRTVYNFYLIKGKHYDAYLYVKLLHNATLSSPKSMWNSLLNTLSWVVSRFGF